MGERQRAEDAVVLGVDLGSSRVKVGAYTADGAQVALVGSPTPTVAGSDGIDFPVLAVLQAVDDAVASLGLDVPVVAVGIGSMGEVGTLLSGGTLRDLDFPAWYDDRGAEVVGELELLLDRSVLDERTGGHVRAVSSLAKLAWLARHRHPVAGTFLGLAGAVCFELTGVARQEASLACTSGAFDPLTRRWWTQPWQAAGLSAVTLPALQAPDGWAPAAGARARAWGLADGAPVLIAGHDHLVAAVGSGARVGDVVDSLGTGEPVLAAAPGGRLRDAAAVGELVRAGLTIECWPPTGDPTVAFEGLRPGLAMGTFLQASGMSRAELDRRSPPPGVAAPLEESVVDDLEAGRPRPVGPDEWAALLDHYARRAAAGERIVRTATGAEGPTLVTGGGTRSARWLLAKQACTSSRLHVVTTEETAARGAAAMAGVALGWWGDPASMPGLRTLTTDKTARVPPGDW